MKAEEVLLNHDDCWRIGKTIKEEDGFKFAGILGALLRDEQLKRVIEWGDEECPHLDPPQRKRECGICWQELRLV